MKLILSLIEEYLRANLSGHLDKYLLCRKQILTNIPYTDKKKYSNHMNIVDYDKKLDMIPLLGF